MLLSVSTRDPGQPGSQADAPVERAQYPKGSLKPLNLSLDFSRYLGPQMYQAGRNGKPIDGDHTPLSAKFPMQVVMSHFPFPQYLRKQPSSSSPTPHFLVEPDSISNCSDHLPYTSSKQTLYGHTWSTPGMTNAQPPPPACGASLPFPILEDCAPNDSWTSPEEQDMYPWHDLNAYPGYSNLNIQRNLNEGVHITSFNGRSPSEELPLEETPYIPVETTYDLRSYRNELTSFPPLQPEPRSKGGLPRTCAICQSTSGCLEKGCHRGEGVDEEEEMDIDKSTSRKRQREVYEDGKRPPDMPPTKRAKRRTHPRQRNSGGVKGGGK
ncbi:hypothetical protein CPB86DRAFT_325437 [Serendipita vermifera]|nr:hypothetical protein CPB86DRAFT_325437 [Serendipita vermifera]